MAENVGLSEMVFSIGRKCALTEESIRESTSLSPSEYRVVDVLSPDSSICSSDLADKLSISPSRCSRIVEKMVRGGYLVAEHSLSDKRNLVLTLTVKGRAVREKILSLKLECDKRIENAISAEDAKNIRNALNVLLKAL